ncbi:hypothetical protein ABB37_03718 [Leptomonas pyrrhocoris]|uniref:Uncharacterized protein n=1 Tax=Leptomonas pyrrhocoris TaxID=157538 RepID=A0A0N0DW59_LEPPY|nr:hypothetical protein ABB37_03718 [Leptomonas pyrrhocoris]KPA81318.1 hypothetical protein ABB37_03718 [Leptomonas pyrrhocoris]|eukprot:XP_015659757.1 hypothetical protein ABB37_03718 [Leptomonas pyrrhocoris]
MNGNHTDRDGVARRDATLPSELPAEVRRVALDAPPAAPASASSASGFAGVQLRPDGQRYGDADLVPGGSLEGSGGMLMNERNFPVPGRGLQEGPSAAHRDGFGTADGYARFDPMFPGQVPVEGRGGRGGSFGGGRGGPGSAPRMPGEPDDDIFLPPGGRPGEPFGGPGGGQFGPRQGGFGGRGGQGGGSSPWM